MIDELDDLFRSQGKAPPYRPYWSRLKEIHQMVESRGYIRNNLSNYYDSFIMKKYTAEELQERKRTFEKHEMGILLKMFKDQEREAIEEWIGGRLKDNEYDIPALWAQMSLNYSVFTIEELLNTVEKMVIALDYFQPRKTPKEALLHVMLDVAMNWASKDEDSIEYLKQKGGGKIGFAFPTLFIRSR